MKEASIGIIFSHDKNSVLLVKRRDVPIWVLPAGGIEENETPEDACLREVLEETGVQTEIVRKVGLWLPINRLATPAHVFVCQSLNPKPPLLPQEESQQVQFWPLADLPKTLFFLHNDWINAARQNDVLCSVHKMTQLTYFKALMLFMRYPIYTVRYLLSRLGCPINR